MADLTLAEFLSARLDEREAAAKAATRNESGYWLASVDGEVFADADRFVCSAAEADATHIMLNDPASVLRDIAAKRAVLAEYNRALAAQDKMLASPAGDKSVTYEWENGRACALLLALRGFAAADSGHPDYREEWRS